MTTIATTDSPDHHLRVDSIPVIDLRYLTQSELTSLSLCSDKSFDLRRCDDVIIPKIDRSVFNESAGSRKQTYSRLRLAPRKPEISAVGRGRYNPVSKPHTNPVDDPERKENKEIVSLIRGLFGDNSDIQFKDPIELEKLQLIDANHERDAPAAAQPQPQALVVIPEGGVKRKRGRPRKDRNEVVSYEPAVNYAPEAPNPKIRKVEGGEDFYENVQINENVQMEIVNKNGVVVDLNALAFNEDPYGPELRRRSAGLTTEVELLVFLRGLEGQWGSRRKKRKVVDASDFGDALPIGWKILISLKRKEGNLSLYCRRYISPTGQQFVTCKEVSAYLLPYFGFQDENNPNSFQSDESDNGANKLSSGSSAGPACKDDSTKYEMICYDASSTPIVSVSSEHEKQNPLLGTDNLAEVEIRDLLECHICKMNFDEKDAYLRHLLSSHQKTAKRPRHGNTSVCDGVIIKDGKFECQFCHKVFEERHRYNGHVGVHVRNYVRSLELSPTSTTENNAKPSVSGDLPKFSEIAASAGTNGVSAAVTCKPCDESSSQSSVKSASASRVLSRLSGVVKSDDTDKGSVPLMSMPSDEGTTENSVKPSSVSGLLPGVSKVEASTSMAQSSISPISVLSNETTTQNNAKPSSVNRDLGTSEVSTSDHVDKVSVPLTSSPCSEGTKQDNSTPSPLGDVLPGVSGVDALVVTDSGSVPQASSLKNESSMEDNSKPSSVSMFLSELGATASGSDPQSSPPKNEISTENGSKPSAVNMFCPELAATESGSGVVVLAATDSGSVRPASSPKNEISTENNSKPSSVSIFLPELAATESGSGVEVAATDSSVRPSSSPKNEISTENNSKPSSVSIFLPEVATTESVSGVEALAATDSGSVSPASSPKNGSVSGVEALAVAGSGSVPPASSPKNERSTENNSKTSSASLFIPEFTEAETLTDNFKASVIPPSLSNNDVSIDSPCKPDMDSNRDGCVSESNSGQSSPHTKSDAGVYIPLSSHASSDLENLDSSLDNTGPGSIPEKLISPSNVELNVSFPCSEQDVLANKIDESLGGKYCEDLPNFGHNSPHSAPDVSSPCSEQDVLANKFDVSLGGKYGEDLPTFGHNSPHSAPDTGGYSSQSALDNSNGESLGSPCDNMGLRPVLENSTSTSDFGLNVGFPCSEQDAQAYKIDEAGGKSGDKQDSDNEMTDAEVYRLDKNYYDMNVDLRPCLDYTSTLCNNVDDGTLEIFKGKDALTSEIGGKLCKLDQSDNDLDCDSKPYFGSANALHFNLGSANDLHNNVENGTNVNFKRNDIFTSSAVGGNVSGGSRGESSFCFSFAPSGTQKNNSAEVSKDRVFSTHVKNPAFDRSKGFGVYEPERCFGVNTSHYRESSGGFPTTLDLMSNKGQRDSGNCLFNVKNSELDRGKGYAFNEPERSFGTNIGQSNLDFFRDATGSADRTMLQRSVTDTSSARPFGTNMGQSNLDFFREGTGSAGRTMLQRSVADTSLARPFGTNIGQSNLDFLREGTGTAGRTMLQRPVADTSSARPFGTNISQSNLDFFREGTGSADRTMLQRSVADTSSSYLQPSSCFSTLDLMSDKSSSCFTTLELMPNKSPGSFSGLEFPSNKGQGGIGNFSLQKFDNVSSFDELGLDDLDPSKFGFVAAKESSCPTQEPMDMNYDSVMEDALNTPLQFGWDAVLPKMNNNQQQTTICMWCRIPFNHAPTNLEMQSDSIGFMCPTCKAKISGQLNVFGQ